ncbi:MAG: S8 family serine peptidase, partial [Polyangiaceae bacterium]
MSNRRVWLGGVLVLGLGFTASCSSDIERLSPLPSTGGGSATAASGTGGMVPVPDPTRGDPLTFPNECPETCDEACGRLAQCDGQGSEIYPTDKDECLVRCNLAESGPLWDDQSGHFKCCTAQQGCDLIQHCGGWLKHPAVVASCATLCSCIFASPVATLTDGLKPPTGYRFAPDLLILAPHSSAALTHIRGLTVFRAGAYPIVKLSEEADEDTARRLATFGRVLPTFVDKEGRVSAATGRLFITLASQGLFDQVDAIGRAYGKLAPMAYGERLYLIEVADPWKALALQGTLNELSGVTAELDMIRDYQWRYEPDDPSFTDQWHLKNTGQTGGAAGIDGRVSEAWDVTLGDAAVVIAVNDDGVDLNHPEFAGRLKTEQNYPADWEAQMKQGAFGSHGTSCAGVAAAGADNADKGAGVCPSCTILPRLLGTSVGGSFQVSDKDIADGFVELVDAGAWVVSNSWGP